MSPEEFSGLIFAISLLAVIILFVLWSNTWFDKKDKK